ncbi:hypothetical protein [Streptomyces sp. NPDC002851]
MASRGGGPVELVEDRLREALLVECRARTIEPPGRIVTAAQTRAEKTFCARCVGMYRRAIEVPES